MAHLKQPYLVTPDGTHYYPGCTAESVTDTESVERYDHIAASGNRGSVLVGSRDFKDVTFNWISDAVKATLITWWDAVKDGSEFDYVMDDSVRKFGTGPPASWKFDTASYIFGDDIDGAAITSGTYTIENTELVFSPGQIDGYWTLSIRMREAV
jgi:hypothetical protein